MSVASTKIDGVTDSALRHFERQVARGDLSARARLLAARLRAPMTVDPSPLLPVVHLEWSTAD